MYAHDSGRHVFGAGVIALAVVCLAFRDFDPGQPVPQSFPGRTLLAFTAAVWMLAAGSAIQSRRLAARAGAALATYYFVFVVLLMNGRAVIRHPLEFGSYSGAAEQLAIAAGALIVCAMHANIDRAKASSMARAGQLLFGLCSLLFGGAHFWYMNLTAPLVPRWLPPSGEFWGYATGVAFLAAGIALLTGWRGRLAAILLTAMFGVFAVLVHAPMFVAHPSSRAILSENALNLAILGASWVVADSLATPHVAT